MSMNFQDISLIKGYHAHVYFDKTTFEQAKILCEAANQEFSLTLGRMHQKPVGLHPCWSCQLAFELSEYGKIVSWLALNRKGLTILIHPSTGNDLRDHTDYALWMGVPQPLKLEVLS